jgi:aromatic ring-opening dioxygenase catalytic subunit (LigB family)
MGQVIYLSHGGGPLPILGDQGHRAMIDFMRRLPAQLRRPEAILVLSAHWEEAVPTVLGSRTPRMLYDYYGFPDEAYQITYPARGSPELARRISELLSAQGRKAQFDPDRGFDHGLFIPLKLIYPKADVPSLQLSLIQGLDPEAHIALGRALRELQRDNILVIGSGFSFHNLRAFSWRETNIADTRNDAFQNWLIETCSGQISQAEREQRLIDWEKAPSARYCHPREEHLLPLHVCSSIAGSPARVVFDDQILGKRALAFLWE